MGGAGPAPEGLDLTHAYASLEALQHLLGRGDGVDLAAADAYAVGATLFQLAMGELPARVTVGRRDSAEEVLAMWETCLLQQVRASGTALSQASLLLGSRQRICSVTEHALVPQYAAPVPILWLQKLRADNHTPGCPTTAVPGLHSDKRRAPARRRLLGPRPSEASWRERARRPPVQTSSRR